MATSNERDKEHGKGHLAMNTPPIVSQQKWEAARQQLLVKEKALTRSRDALAAERRRMPWLAVDKQYGFDGPKGKVSLLDLFEGRRQLIVYRAFFRSGRAGRRARADALAGRGQAVRVRRAEGQGKPARFVRGPPSIDRLSRLLRAPGVRLARARLPRLLPGRRSGRPPGHLNASRAPQADIARLKGRL